MNAIHIDRKDMLPTLIGGYSGNKFRVQITDSVNIPSHAGNWDGGSRNTYSIVRISDGASVAGSDNMKAPWDNSRRDKLVTLDSNTAVVKHSIFSGKDMGLHIYVHPDAVNHLRLPAPVELSNFERFVLIATASYKSSYSGMDRYQMASRDASYRKAEKDNIPSRDEYETAKSALIARKFLNKAGAITTVGRNAIGGDRF